MLLADFQAPLDRISAAVTNVGNDVTSLKNSLTSKLSDADEASIVSQLGTIATNLEGIHTAATADTTPPAQS